MSKKLSEITGLEPDFREFESTDRLLLSRCNTGIEIEAENVHHRDSIRRDVKFWTLKDDGSLRNRGVEFVLTRPLRGADIVHSLEEIEAAIKRYDPEIDMSDRTSLHVHLDVRNYDTQKLLTYIVLNIILEKILFSYAGMDRYYSNFCTPILECKRNSVAIGNIIDSKDFMIHGGLNSQGRYASINVASVTRHGSIEYRMHKGTYKANEIINWLNILYSIKNYANNYKGDVQSLIDKVCKDKINFFQDIFTKYTDLIDLSPREIMEYMLEGAREAQYIANSVNITKLSKDYYSDKEDSLYDKLYGKLKVPPRTKPKAWSNGQTGRLERERLLMD